MPRTVARSADSSASLGRLAHGSSQWNWTTMPWAVAETGLSPKCVRAQRACMCFPRDKRFWDDSVTPRSSCNAFHARAFSSPQSARRSAKHLVPSRAAATENGKMCAASGSRTRVKKHTFPSRSLASLAAARFLPLLAWETDEAGLEARRPGGIVSNVAGSDWLRRWLACAFCREWLCGGSSS